MSWSQERREYYEQIRERARSLYDTAVANGQAQGSDLFARLHAIERLIAENAHAHEIAVACTEFIRLVNSMRAERDSAAFPTEERQAPMLQAP